jgi:hypothetical protein
LWYTGCIVCTAVSIRRDALILQVFHPFVQQNFREQPGAHYFSTLHEHSHKKEKPRNHAEVARL